MKNVSVESMLKEIEVILNATHEVVSSMNDGDRMQIQKLAQTVSQTVAMDPKFVLNFVNHYAHTTDVAYVTRGKNGGLVKGVKQAKVVKVKSSSDNS